MIDYPKTIEEARQYKYRQWAGNPNGNPYRNGFCAWEVWPNDRGGLPHQCHKKSGYGINGLYCKQHAKILDGTYNMEKKIHQTHFTVPELPHKKKEREAILAFKRIVEKYKILIDNTDEYYSMDELGGDVICIMDTCSDDLIDWVMKYKGE